MFKICCAGIRGFGISILSFVARAGWRRTAAENRVQAARATKHSSQQERRAGHPVGCPYLEVPGTSQPILEARRSQPSIWSHPDVHRGIKIFAASCGVRPAHGGASNMHK